MLRGLPDLAKENIENRDKSKITKHLISPICFCQRETIFFFLQRDSFMVWEINIGVSPGLEFDDIMFINCLEYIFYIYGAFEFLCNSIANL